MYHALSKFPHTAAVAAWAVARVGSQSYGLPGLMMRIDPHPIDRGVSR
jgi:hypothetical protein